MTCSSTCPRRAMPDASSASGRSCIVERMVLAKKVASHTACLGAIHLPPGRRHVVKQRWLYKKVESCASNTQRIRNRKPELQGIEAHNLRANPKGEMQVTANIAPVWAVSPVHARGSRSKVQIGTQICHDFPERAVRCPISCSAD
jgi:hypothetical protein